MKTGIQISSLKPLIQTEADFRAACGKIAALGCETVQLQWLGREIPPETVARILRETGLNSVSIQDFYGLVLEDFEYYVNLNAATGGRWFTVSRIPEDCKSPEGLEEFIRQLRELQRRLDSRNQKLLFHPVTADFRAVPGINPVEYLMEHMPELELCLDLFHLNRNCGDMPGFIRCYAGRIPMVHFKDENAEGKLVSAGSGIVRWEGVAEACRDTGVLWGFAEQETWEEDPYLCLGRALEWIRAQL